MLSAENFTQSVTQGLEKLDNARLEISQIDMFLSSFQALYGFLFVVTCDGEVFYAARTVEQYLGFHQVRKRSSKIYKIRVP